jgi:hypothetical protein
VQALPEIVLVPTQQPPDEEAQTDSIPEDFMVSPH